MIKRKDIERAGIRPQELFARPVVSMTFLENVLFRKTGIETPANLFLDLGSRAEQPIDAHIQRLCECLEFGVGHRAVLPFQFGKAGCVEFNAQPIELCQKIFLFALKFLAAALHTHTHNVFIADRLLPNPHLRVILHFYFVIFDRCTGFPDVTNRCIICKKNSNVLDFKITTNWKGWQAISNIRHTIRDKCPNSIQVC